MGERGQADSEPGVDMGSSEGGGVPLCDRTAKEGSDRKGPKQRVDKGVFQACLQHSILSKHAVLFGGGDLPCMCMCVTFLGSHYKIFQTCRK